MILRNNKIFQTLSLLNIAFGRYKWQIAAMAVLTSMSGVLEGIGINAVIPLFSLADKNQPEASDIISKTIKNIFLFFHINPTVKYLLILIAALFVVKALFLFISQFITLRISADYQKKTRSELLQLFLQTHWPYLSKQKIGHIDQVLVQNVYDSSTFLIHIGAGFLIVINLLIYSLLVINISSAVVFLALIFGFLVIICFRPLFYKTRMVSHQIVKKKKNLAHYLNENIIGAKSVKSMSIEEQVFKNCLKYFDDLKNLQIKVGWMASLNQILLQPIGIFFIIGVFVFFYKNTLLNFASFAVSIYAITKVFSNIQSVQSEIYSWNAGLPSLLSVLGFRDEVLRHQEENVGGKKFGFRNFLEFRDVAFSYDKDGSEAVLSDISFPVKKGEIVGLIGSSGAGKTTIVDLLLRLLRPVQGKIVLDELDISEISLQDWRINVGYVSQDIFLINDTILNNIKFYGDSIAFEEVVAAAKTANIYEFINSLPEKFETMVGERGIQLSVGQRQRVVLARILARKPKILILDEATSALDNESEALIQKSLEKLRGEVTIIAIAHRLSTVLDFDKLLVLEGGKIVEVGVPRELLKDPNSHFYKLYNLKR